MTLEEIQAALAAAKTRRDSLISDKVNLLTVQIPAARALTDLNETGQEKRDRVRVLEDRVALVRQEILQLSAGRFGSEVDNLAVELGAMIRERPYDFVVSPAA